jgi:hypothetical protein
MINGFQVLLSIKFAPLRFGSLAVFFGLFLAGYFLE